MRDATVKIVIACRGAAPRSHWPAKGDYDACVKLLRACQPQALTDWLDDALLVMAAGHDCPGDPFEFLRSKKYDKSVSTMTRVHNWEDRLSAARDWDTKGRPTATSGIMANGRVDLRNAHKVWDDYDFEAAIARGEDVF